MRLPILGALVFGVLLIQGKPDFSGTWTLDNGAGGSDPTAKMVVVIAQTDTTITLSFGDRTLSMPLDGSEATMKVSGPAGPQDLTLRARWDGARLMVEQRTATTSIVQTVSLSNDGSELTVETVAHVPGGEKRATQRFKKS
jgi:hypothetical protein